MGLAFSTWGLEPLYLRTTDPEYGFKNYDYWGWIPPGLTPSQHVWHTYFADSAGGARLNAPPQPPAPDTRPGQLQFGVVSSLPEFILKPNFLTQDDAYVTRFRPIADTLPGEQWFKDGKSGVLQQPKTTWSDRWVQEKADGKAGPDAICHPGIFPRCTMQPIADDAGIFRDFTGQTQDTMYLWATTIDNLYEKFYVNGNVDELDKINSQDLSDYDPCDQPGFLARVMPIVLGALTGAGFQKLFATDLRATLSSTTMNAASFGTFFFGFFWMRGAMDVFGPAEENLRLAAGSVALPIGLAVGDYFINKGTVNASNTTIYVVCAGASLFVVLPIVQHGLGLPGPISLILNIVGTITSAVSRFLCRMGSPEYDSCEAKDKDGKKLFTDARRWDVASIAAKLTDEVRSQEGWERSDPRCEFAFKAFMTSPAMLDALRGPLSGKRPMWESGVANPLGNIVAPEALQGMQEMGSKGTPEMQYAAGTVYMWTGGSDLDFWRVASGNEFACQNWETMRGIGIPPKMQSPEGKHLYETFNEWVAAVRDAANNPNNLALAGIGRETSGIPGWKGGTAFPLPTVLLLTDSQAEEMIMLAYGAKTVQARYDLVKGYETTFSAPKNRYMDTWIQANFNVYQFLTLKEGKTAEDVWAYIQGFPMQSDQLRSAFIYAITATTDPVLWDFWDKSPPPMREAALKFKPQDVLPDLPYGLLPKLTSQPIPLPPPPHHWHWSTPLEPVQGGQSLCAEFLGKLRGTIDDPNSRNFTVFQWQQACKMILGRVNPKICTACSMGQVCTVFAYSLFFDAYDNAGAGVGWFCDQLKNKFKWSDMSVAAALQNLNTSLDYNSNLKNYMAFWWGQYDWSVTNWYEYVQNALKVEGAHYDDTANICGSMTSLTPLQRQEQPLTDEHLSRLFDPASERPKDFRSYVTNVAGSFYKLFTGETPITDLMPHDPISLHWQDNEWSRHVYRPLPPGWNPGFPVPIHWDNPPPELKHLQAPPPPGPGHITPFPLPMDPLYPHPPDPSNTNYCAVIFDALQNPPNAQWTNLSGTQMRTILAPMFTLQSCTDCEWADRMNLWMYYIVNPQGQAFANGVGNWIDQNTNPQWTPNPWSDDALSAGLNALQQPLHNQENLSGYITAFMSNPVASNGTDYTAKIKQLLQSPGNWDRTPGFCGP